MNQLREQEESLAEQELCEQGQAAQEKEELPQNSDIRQLIGEVCGIKVCEEQKQNMEDTVLELLEVCQQKEFYCIHNDVDDLIKSALTSKLLSINLESQRLDKEKQEVKNIVEQPTKCRTSITESLQNFRVIHKKSTISLNNTPQISSVNAITTILPTEEPEYSLSMRYKHLTTIPETKSDEVIKSSVKNLVQIPSKYEVTSDDKNSLFYSSPKFDHLEEFSSELMPTSIIDEERIKREHKEYISLIEKLLAINSFPRTMENFHANTIVETFPTSPILVEDSDSLREKIDIFTGTDDLMPPGIERDDYDSKGDIYFLKELLVNDSIPLPENESSNFNHHDDPSFPRPPPKPSNVEFFFDFEPDSGELISVMMNNIDELNEDECFDPGGEIDVFENIEDDNYFPFIFVIRIFLPYLTYPEVSPLLLSTGSEDTIFYPGIST
nr:hypothetical protein [Tanacetum cinerariifolium]